MIYFFSIMLTSASFFNTCPTGLQAHVPFYKAMVDDAAGRWEEKNKGFDNVLEGRCPVYMEFEEKFCIKLQKLEVSIGEDPIYCYTKDGSFIKAYDDVE